MFSFHIAGLFNGSHCFLVVERSEREKQELEKRILKLRAKLSQCVVASEVEELKRCIEHKDKERMQLTTHIEVTFFLF